MVLNSPGPGLLPFILGLLLSLVSLYLVLVSFLKKDRTDEAIREEPKKGLYGRTGLDPKNTLIAEAIPIALARFTKGRPVKAVFSREEELTATQIRVGAFKRLRTGIKKDGALTARKADIDGDTAWPGCLEDDGRFRKKIEKKDRKKDRKKRLDTQYVM
jgi:hypothetical protein